VSQAPRLSAPDRGDGLEKTIERVLACPKCQGGLAARGGVIRCLTDSCGFVGEIRDTVVLMHPSGGASWFDDKHQIMRHGSETAGVRRCCYAEQASIIESSLGPGTTVLDVGCGPALPYQRTRPYFLIGLDPSYESLRENVAVDLRVYGHAGNLPLANRTVDAVVSLYAIHHFGGRSRAENRDRVARGFKEFGRVLKPGGNLFIFEVEPWWPAWVLQCATWNVLRKLLPSLDMFFWREEPLRQVATTHLGRTAAYRTLTFKAPLWTPLAPIFALPRIQVPRWLFPFRVNMYHWRV
jgi:ubiquinone/menaquinone biosynthesis C-methylase UbiE